jgi:hypothetical protein
MTTKKHAQDLYTETEGVYRDSIVNSTPTCKIHNGLATSLVQTMHVLPVYKACTPFKESFDHYFRQ